MVVLLYPGLLDFEFPVNLKTPEKYIICKDEMLFWWYSEGIYKVNRNYIHYFCSNVLARSKEGSIVIVFNAQPEIRETICKMRDKEKICIIFPAPELKEKYLNKIETLRKKNKDYKSLIYYNRLFDHAKEYFEFDLRSIMYEAGYNRKWYDVAYAIKDENYDIFDIIEKIKDQIGE